MKKVTPFITGVAWSALILSGCTGSPEGTHTGSSPAPNTTDADQAGTDAKAEREAAFAKLGAEDRALAEAQGYCAVSGAPLGSMGTPPKLTVKDQAVFLCCSGCESAARANPDQTLAKMAEMKAKVQAEKAQP